MKRIKKSVTSSPFSTIFLAGSIFSLAILSLSFPREASAQSSPVRTDLYNNLIQESASVPISVTTSSFTPPDNSLLVVITGIENDGTHGTVTVSGGGLTWTKRIDTGADYIGTPPTYYGVLQYWTAPVTTGASMTVTVASTDTSGTDPARIVIQAVAYTNYNTSDPIGVATTSQDMGDAAKTISFTSAPAATSEVVAARYRLDNSTANSTASQGTGWTEIYDLATGNGYGDMQTMARANSTSQNITWDNVSDNASANSWVTWGAGLEIKVAEAVSAGRVIRLRGGIRLLGGVRLR